MNIETYQAISFVLALDMALYFLVAVVRMYLKK